MIETNGDSQGVVVCAVNRRTKEHLVMPFYDANLHGKYISPDWQMVESGSDGWIRHLGAENPMRDGDLCDYRGKSGITCNEVPAQNLAWRYVREYRPILDDQGPVEYSGETRGIDDLRVPISFGRVEDDL